MPSLFQRFMNIFRRRPVNKEYWLISRTNARDKRRAFLWDGESIDALREFLGYNQVKWNTGGSVTVAGYNQIILRPYTYIWDDSDGFDCGILTTVLTKFTIHPRTN